jgi:hypothetical protein
MSTNVSLPYPTKFLVIHFRDDLALGIGSLAQNVDDGLFVRAESLHGNSPEKFTY